jgi:hypothetical protein
LDDGCVGGDDDADDGERLSAVRASVLSTVVGDVVGERSRDAGDAGDAGDAVGDAVGVGDGVVAVAFAPGRPCGCGCREPVLPSRWTGSTYR